MIQYVVFHCVPFFIHSSRLIRSDVKQTFPTSREPPAGPWVGYQRQDLHLRPTQPSLPPKRALSSTEKLKRRNVGWEQLLRAESKAGESEAGSAGSTKRKGEWFPGSKPQLLLHHRKRGSCLPPSILHYHYSHNQIYSTKLRKMYRLPSICSALPYAGNHRDRRDRWSGFPMRISSPFGETFHFHEYISLTRQLSAKWPRHREVIRAVHQGKRSHELDWSETTSHRRWVSGEPAWKVSAWLDGEEEVYSFPGGRNKGESSWNGEEHMFVGQ